MEDDLALFRIAGLALSDEDASQLIELRRHFVDARATLAAIHLGETEPVVTFSATNPRLEPREEAS
jgi:hypothetical protein